MPHLVKHILMATPVKNSPLKLLTNFILFLTYLYGSQSSSMTVLTARQTNIFQLNPKTFLLLFRFMKTLLTLITEFLWTLKVLFPHLLKTTPIFLLLLTHLVISLLLTQLLTLLLNMQFKLFSIIGSQSLVPLSILLQIEVLNILIKTWLISSLFHINHSPRTPYSPWTNGLVEVQNRILGTHLRIFLQNPPTNWSFQTQMYAYTHNTTPLSQLKLFYTRLFSIPILAYLSPFPLIYLEMLKKLYCNLLRISFSSFTL